MSLVNICLAIRLFLSISIYFYLFLFRCVQKRSRKRRCSEFEGAFSDYEANSHWCTSGRPSIWRQASVTLWLAIVGGQFFSKAQANNKHIISMLSPFPRISTKWRTCYMFSNALVYHVSSRHFMEQYSAVQLENPEEALRASRHDHAASNAKPLWLLKWMARPAECGTVGGWSTGRKQKDVSNRVKVIQGDSGRWVRQWNSLWNPSAWNALRNFRSWV